MITKEIGISGEKFRVVLTEQIISQVNNLAKEHKPKLIR